MSEELFLADTSALARLPKPPVASVLEKLILEGRVLVTGVVLLELLRSPQNRDSYLALAENLRSLPLIPMTEALVLRSLDVQATLADASAHRGVKVPDLLIAAAAEAADVTVLHYDHDFDLIASVTGQPTRWVIERGSVD